jgi:cell division protein FtsB
VTLHDEIAQNPQPAAGGRSRARLALAGVVSGILLLGAVFGRHGLLEVRQYREERDRLRQEIVDLELQVHELEAEVKALREDPRAIERIAREDLALARPGEHLVLLPPSSRPTPQP